MDFSTEIPSSPGKYVFSCGEIDDKEEELELVMRNGLLIVLCPDLGPTVVKAYHEGLTNPKWLRL